MRPTAWHTALTLSVTAHAAALGFGAAWPSAPAPGQSIPEQVRLTVVTAPQEASSPTVRVAPDEPPAPVEPVRAVQPDASLPVVPSDHSAVSRVPAPAAVSHTTVAAVVAPVAQAPARDTPPLAVAMAGAMVDSAPALPVPGGNPPPRYPRVARRNGWEGPVLLLVDVTADGSVQRVLVAESSGHEVLDQAALEAVQRWRFAPARAGGVPLASAVRVPVIFRLEDAAPH